MNTLILAIIKFCTTKNLFKLNLEQNGRKTGLKLLLNFFFIKLRLFAHLFGKLLQPEDGSDMSQLIERQNCNRKVAKRWIDSRCSSAPLCPWEKHLMLFPILGPSRLPVVVA